VPFGGYKESGVGREKSEYALQAYTQVRISRVAEGYGSGFSLAE
jgi:acyl-CoA reductase-like NAD-dependent aldehyde dehydrogenase